MQGVNNVKRNLAILLGFLTLCLMISVTTPKMEAQAAGPKVTIKKYKDKKEYQYAVISGAKYKKANAQMLAYTKHVYRVNEKLQKKNKEDLKKGSIPNGMPYFSVITCSKKFSQSSKVSIFCEKYTYTGGAHGMPYSKTFNFLNGKSMSLKGAFQSAKSYEDGKAYAKRYILSHPEKYPFADSHTSIAGHSFFWTTKGLKVIFEPYEVSSFADGFKYVSISSKYLKN